jgi:hypothetical protein
MIGWRPLLLTAVAVALLVVVGLDAAKSTGPCSSADAVIGAREYVKARASYATVLEHDSHSSCAKAGLARATAGECVRAERIADTDAPEARTELLAVAEADPPPGPDACVWTELSALDPAASHAPRTPSAGGKP